MYYYIFEPTRNPTELERMGLIKQYLSKLGIAGEMITPSQQRSIPQLIESAIEKRYSTIVIVGGTAFIHASLSALQGNDIVCGLIPLEFHPDISALIGCTDWKSAAEHLKSRLWKPVQLGRINNDHYFLTPASIELPEEDKDNFSLETKHYQLIGKSANIQISPVISDSTSYLHVTSSPPTPPLSFFSRVFSKNNIEEHQPTSIQEQSFTLETLSPLPVDVAGTRIATTPIKCSMSTSSFRLIICRAH